MAGKAVAKAEKSNVPAFMQDQDLSAHTEQMSQDDVSIPFLQILQQLSPMCVDGDPQFIEGAKPSMVYNTVTKELIETKDKGFEFVPVSYKDTFVEWVTRNNGGGFVKEYNIADGETIITARNENGHDIIQEGSPLGTPGNQLNRTHTHFIFVLTSSGYEPAVMSMAITQLKPSKNLNSLINNHPFPGIGVLRFGHVIQAKTEMRKNDQGSWYIWSWNYEGPLEDENIFEAAKAFATGVRSGEHKADHAKADGADGDAASPAKADTGTDEEVPF